jgi:hypothetical protein
MDETKVLALAMTFINDDDYLASVYYCFRRLGDKDDLEKLEKIKALNHVELASLEVLLEKIS